jgi:hypothetical protein
MQLRHNANLPFPDNDKEARKEFMGGNHYQNEIVKHARSKSLPQRASKVEFLLGQSLTPPFWKIGLLLHILK